MSVDREVCRTPCRCYKKNPGMAVGEFCDGGRIIHELKDLPNCPARGFVANLPFNDATLRTLAKLNSSIAVVHEDPHDPYIAFTLRR